MSEIPNFLYFLGDASLSALKVVTPTNLPSLVAFLSAAISLAFAVAGFVARAQFKSQLEKLHAAEDARNLEVALQSDDLASLGKYLENTLGDVSLWSYRYSKDDAKKIDGYLERLVEFTAKEPTTDAPSATLSVGETALRPNQSSNVAAPMFLQAMTEVEEGKTWNALAMLRRDMERRFRRLIKTLDPKISWASLGAMIRHPHIRDLLSTRNVDDEQLRAIISIANRAVHGDDVTADEAQNAILAAADIYMKLDWNEPLPPDSSVSRRVTS